MTMIHKGDRFGLLTVVKRAKDYVSPKGKHAVVWCCLCDCGTQVMARGDTLKRGAVVSCGCYRASYWDERAELRRQFGKQQEMMPCRENTGEK